MIEMALAKQEIIVLSLHFPTPRHTLDASMQIEQNEYENPLERDVRSPPQNTVYKEKTIMNIEHKSLDPKKKK